MATFTDRNVFITGGSTGIGRAIALDLAARGANVTVCARSQGALDDAVAALHAVRPGRHAAVTADVTDAQQMQAAAAHAIAAMGHVDLLVCNSGFSRSAPAEATSPALYRQLMDVNYFGHVNTYLAFQRHMAERRTGDIVFVSSMLAVFSVWGYGAYAASKFAVTGFAQSVRQEMKAHGVRVKLFLPPSTDTPGFAAENEDKPALLHEFETGSALNAVHRPDAVAARFVKWLPSNRFFGVATWDSRLQWFFARHFPELTLKIADSDLRNAEKRLARKRLAASGG